VTGHEGTVLSHLPRLDRKLNVAFFFFFPGARRAGNSLRLAFSQDVLKCVGKSRQNVLDLACRIQAITQRLYQPPLNDRVHFPKKSRAPGRAGALGIADMDSDNESRDGFSQILVLSWRGSR